MSRDHPHPADTLSIQAIYLSGIGGRTTGRPSSASVCLTGAAGGGCTSGNGAAAATGAGAGEGA